MSLMKADLVKVEANSKKAGKKNPETLKLAIAALNQKIKESEQLKSDKLRQVMLLERKKYCALVSSIVPSVQSLIELSVEGTKFKENENLWKSLAISQQNIPLEVENILKNQQERTLYMINSSEIPSTANVFSGYDTYFGDANENNFLGTGTLLYDFEGTNPSELPVYAGFS